MKNGFFLLIFYFLYVSNAQGQVVKKSIRDIEFSLDIAYKQLYQNSSFEIDRKVDPVVDTARYHDYLEYYEPFQHNALYFMLGANISYKNKYKLSFKSFYEQRGWSGGVNNSYSNAVYPNFKFEAEDTLFFKNDFIKFKFEMGDMYDADEYNLGLRNYNIDYQGIMFNSFWKRNYLGVNYSSDLAKGIGLKIDEYAHVKLGRYDSLWAKRQIDYGVSIDYIQYIESTVPLIVIENYYSFGAYFRTDITDELNFSFVGDYALSPKRISPNTVSNIGLSMYFTYSVTKGKSHLFIQPKYRFYGINYIYPHYENEAWGYNYLYRHEQYPYVNGQYLYPLRNYFRPVSQWAFYTEYGDVSDVHSFEVRAVWDWNIYKKLHHKLDFELINIHRSTSLYGNQYTYAFYTSYLYVNVFDGFDVGLYISNKQMNLDVHYQTFYQMKYPFFGFHFTYNGAFDFKNANHREN